jgi:putative transposase
MTKVIWIWLDVPRHCPGLVYQENRWLLCWYAVRGKHWLEVLDMALNRQFPTGVHGKQLFLMSDNGSQPTSVGFMKACRELDINQAFTSYNNPKGNADTERMFRTMKEELIWLREWTSPFELVNALGK